MPKPSFSTVSAYKNLVENKLQNWNMRILNIVFNAEIKYQQYAKLKKFIDKDFWSNFDPGKTHKGKPVREGFLLLLSFWEISFTSV